MNMWKKLSTKTVLEHPRLIVEEDEVEIAPGKTIQYLRYGYGGDGSVIIALNENSEVLFIREYSYVPGRMLLQLPMGKIEDGETPEVAGNRELQEEAGYKARSLVLKGTYYQNNRRSENKGYVVIASDLVSSNLKGDDEEIGIQRVWIPKKEIRKLIQSNEIVDADTLSSLMIADIIN